jgi:hypothetical protein
MAAVQGKPSESDKIFSVIISKQPRQTLMEIKTIAFPVAFGNPVLMLPAIRAVHTTLGYTASFGTHTKNRGTL